MTVANSVARKVNLFTFQSSWIQKLLAPSTLGHRLQNTNWSACKPITSQPPNIVISCGRQAAAAAARIKQQTGCKHIQILNPKGNLSRYDLLLLPKHDEIEAKNVCQFTGSIHAVKKQQSPTKKTATVAVMIGNPEKVYWESQWIKDWQHIKQLGKNITICGSPRLSQDAKSLIREATQIEDSPIWLDEKDGENPYAKLLTEASDFFVTADSINMVNECLATGQTVQLLAANLVNSRRHQNFIQSVQSYLSEKKGLKNPAWPNPIDEITRCDKLQNLLNSPSSFNKG